MDKLLGQNPTHQRSQTFETLLQIPLSICTSLSLRTAKIEIPHFTSSQQSCSRSKHNQWSHCREQTDNHHFFIKHLFHDSDYIVIDKCLLRRWF